MSKTEDLKQVAQIRKAVMPLVELLKAESNKELEARLDKIEASLEKALAFKPEVVVNTTPEIVIDHKAAAEAMIIALEKQNKMLKKGDKPDVIPYQPHDQAKGQGVQYSGFVRSDGAWYIQRVAKGEQRYAKGNGSYQKAWEKRAKQDYGILDGSN